MDQRDSSMETVTVKIETSDSSLYPGERDEIDSALALQIALEKAKHTIELQKLKIIHLQEKVDSLTDDKNFLKTRLEEALLIQEVISSPGQALAASSSTESGRHEIESSGSDSSESSGSSDSSDSEPCAKKKKKDKKQRRKKKYKKQKLDVKRARTPEDSIKRYLKVLHLVNGGCTKAEAYNRANVDRNTIVLQAPIAELAISNPEEYSSLRSNFKNGESIQKFSDLCLARCLAQNNVDTIKNLKESRTLLDISKKPPMLLSERDTSNKFDIFHHLLTLK